MTHLKYTVTRWQKEKKGQQRQKFKGYRICKDCYTKANKSQLNINISFESESNISPFDESEVSRSRDTLNITLDESLEENEANLSTVDKISGKHT